MLKGEIKAGGKAVCTVYIPSWVAKPEEPHLKGGGDFIQRLRLTGKRLWLLPRRSNFPIRSWKCVQGRLADFTA